MKKGFFGGFFGAFFAVILIGLIIGAFGYVMGPKFIPNSPCLVDSNCIKQKTCCTWRCDSAEMDWWECPEGICSMINETATKDDISCKCHNMKCVDKNQLTEEDLEGDKGFLGIF